MIPYKQMDEDSLITEETPDRPTVILPTVIVNPGSQTTNSAQSPQVVVVMSTPQMELSDKRAKILCGLGATQVTIGILEILFNIGASIMWAHVAHFTGGGYWCGIFTVITGSFGIAASKRKGRCWVITFMVLSIIATVLTGLLIIFSSIGIGDARYACYWQSDCRAAMITSEAWNSLLLIAGIIEFIISIVSAAMCCYNLCGKTRPTVIPQGVQYIKGAHQPNVDSQVVAAVKSLQRNVVRMTALVLTWDVEDKVNVPSDDHVSHPGVFSVSVVVSGFKPMFLAKNDFFN